MIERPVLPLFPLSIVVFPGQAVPLHIFEERYKAMIADCRAAEAEGGSMPFVIALQEGDRVQSVGCSLLIQEIVEEMEDGRLHLVCVGQQRVRILEVFEERPYFTAAVQFLDDDDEAVEIEVWKRAVAACVRALEMARADQGAVGEALELEGEPGSFELAHVAGLESKQRQELLEMTREGQRLEWLTHYFDEAVEALERRQKVRQRGKSNGSLRLE